MPLLRYHEAGKGRAHNFVEGCFQHFCEAPVAVKDRTIRCDGRGTFVHLFHEDTVRLLGAFEGEYLLLSFGSVDEQGINLVSADGPERLFRLIEACTQFFEFKEELIP